MALHVIPVPMRNWLRLPPPLRLAIPALVLIFNLCFVAVTAWIIIAKDRVREIERGQINAAGHAERLATAAAENFATGNPLVQGSLFQQELSFVAKDKEVILAVLVSADRRVICGGKTEQQGRNLNSLIAPEVVPAIERVFSGGPPAQIALDRTSVVAAHAVASESDSLKGSVIVVERDLGPAMAGVHQHAVA